MSINCYNCNTELNLKDGQNTSRTEECPKCYANIHSCKMCGFYDTTAYNDCRESSADRILEKDKPNFCDFFKLSNPNAGNSKNEEIYAAADALFKK